MSRPELDPYQVLQRPEGYQTSHLLTELFEQQSSLQRLIGYKATANGHQLWEHDPVDNLQGVWSDQKVALRENVLAMIIELGEMLEHLPTKFYSNRPISDFADERRTQLAKAAEELVDVFHFWINCCLILGLNPHHVSTLWDAKQKVNRERHMDRNYTG